MITNLLRSSLLTGLLAVSLAAGCKAAKPTWSSSSSAASSTPEAPPAHGKAAEPKWLHASPVVLEGNHDPSLIFLKDGRQLEVLYGRTITWEEVNQWRPGRKLTLSYSTLTGPVLLDNHSKRHLPVVGGWGIHPLDSHVDELLAEAVKGPNVPMINTALDVSGLWKAEVERIESELKRRLRGKHRAAFDKAQQAWRQFKAAELSLVHAFNDENAGSHGGFVAAERILTINRDRARMLNGYLNETTE